MFLIKSILIISTIRWLHKVKFLKACQYLKSARKGWFEKRQNLQYIKEAFHNSKAAFEYLAQRQRHHTLHFANAIFFTLYVGMNLFNIALHRFELFWKFIFMI